MKSKILMIFGAFLIAAAMIMSGCADNVSEQAATSTPAAASVQKTQAPAKTPAKTTAKTATTPVKTPTTPVTTPATPAATPAGGAQIVSIASAALIQGEKNLEQTLCGTFPTQASRLPTDMLTLGVLSPGNLNSKISALGDKITFDSTATQLLTAYKNENYFQCFSGTIYNASKECLLPFTANFADGTTEKGLLKMIFTGAIGAYVPQNPVPVNTGGDYGVPKNQYNGMDVMPMLTRASCVVTFQKSCPAKTGSVLCGQCDYSSAGSDAARTANLGQCFYCASTQKCTWGAGGLCSSYSCVNKTTGGTTGTTKQTVYFTSCSGCQNSGYQKTYNYNGTDRNQCRTTYQTCQKCGPTDTRTNCQ
ncbi:MAG: hypothetical protein PHE24_04140 [Patescibacteria group bacterium]|nr:hypothetical protein [Patescibacteria group bacterium]